MASEVRLIDLDKTCSELERFYNGYTGELRRVASDALDLISVMPEVEPESLRPKGRWIDTGNTYEDEHCRYSYFKCSACEYEIAGRYGLHNYCPNCGAKMEG